MKKSWVFFTSDKKERCPMGTWCRDYRHFGPGKTPAIRSVQLSERAASLGNHVCLIEDMPKTPRTSQHSVVLRGSRGPTTGPRWCRDTLVSPVRSGSYGDMSIVWVVQLQSGVEVSVPFGSKSIGKFYLI